MSDDGSSKATYREVIEELTREIETRESVFPRWVAARKMTQAKADRRIYLLKVARLLIEGAVKPKPL